MPSRGPSAARQEPVRLVTLRTDDGTRAGRLDGNRVVVIEPPRADVAAFLDIVSTPDWAYSHQPSGVDAGAPDAVELGEFAHALATHFDGTSLAHSSDSKNSPTMSSACEPAITAPFVVVEPQRSRKRCRPRGKRGESLDSGPTSARLEGD